MLVRKLNNIRIRENGRSSDFVTPNFIYGCAGGCRDSYCYVMRYQYDNINVYTNVDEILNEIIFHKLSLDKKTPNQVDSIYWTYDIGCSTDILLHWKDYCWFHVFDRLVDQECKITFATKYTNPAILKYSGSELTRIRVSLMPERIRQVLERGTSPINKRIEFIDKLRNAGWEVHLNFSPVVIHDEWEEDYSKLFNKINELDTKGLASEVIFLTHNKLQHLRNLTNGNTKSEQLIWRPTLQESKISQYGSEAVRYKAQFKAKLIERFKDLHNVTNIPIRYIF